MARFFAQSIGIDGKPKRARGPRPTYANQGIRAAYHAALTREIAAMRRDVTREIVGVYRRHEPEIAQDAGIFDALKRAFTSVMSRWQKRFDDLAEERADWFVGEAAGHADRSLKRSLKDAGFTVQFQVTPTVADAIEGAAAENVKLIKSIPSECLLEVQELVVESAKRGRDLGMLKSEIERRFDVSDSRAALIARDQNNKVTAEVTRARQQEIGVTQGRWQHSGASKHPRPSHVEADGKVFDLDKGLYLEGEWVLPGQAINCGCTWRMIIPGINDG